MIRWLTEAMRDALGYDEWGNNEALLAPVDKQALEEGTWMRAAGSMLCECGIEYRLHPKVQGCLWLTRTCLGLKKF